LYNLNFKLIPREPNICWPAKVYITMDENLVLQGQRVITPDGKGEVTDATADEIVVKLDDGRSRTFCADDLTDDSNAG
jgi:hypothetical protein